MLAQDGPDLFHQAVLGLASHFIASWPLRGAFSSRSAMYRRRYLGPDQPILSFQTGPAVPAPPYELGVREASEGA